MILSHPAPDVTGGRFLGRSIFLVQLKGRGGFTNVGWEFTLGWSF